MCVADTLWSKAGFVKVMTRKLGCWVGWIAIDIYIYIYTYSQDIYSQAIYIYIYKDSLHFTPCENAVIIGIPIFWANVLDYGRIDSCLLGYRITRAGGRPKVGFP